MTRASRLGVLVCLLAACGGGNDSGGGPTPGPPGIAKAPNSGDQQAGTAGQTLPLPLAVVVTKDGGPLSGTAVNWTAQAGQLSAASSQTDAGGRAEVQWTLDTVAVSQTVEATVPGNSKTVVFIATVRPDVPVNLFKLGGDNQTQDVGLPLAQALTVGLTDRYNNAIDGHPVTWSVSQGSAVLGPALSFTVAGIATTTITLGSTPGAVHVNAVAGIPGGSPLVFNLTATTPPNAITIQVINSRFNPAVDTVAVGGTVDWIWGTGSVAHNVVPTGLPAIDPDPPTYPMDSVTFDAPHSHQMIFPNPGTYRYYCTDHGTPTSGMHGSIVVR